MRDPDLHPTPEGMTDFEADLVHALDSVMSLFELHGAGYYTTDVAMRLLGQAYTRGAPITAAFVPWLRERGLLEPQVAEIEIPGR